MKILVPDWSITKIYPVLIEVSRHGLDKIYPKFIILGELLVLINHFTNSVLLHQTVVYIKIIYLTMLKWIKIMLLKYVILILTLLLCVWYATLLDLCKYCFYHNFQYGWRIGVKLWFKVWFWSVIEWRSTDKEERTLPLHFLKCTVGYIYI